MTKFLIIGDLHGNKPKIYYKDFDAIIAPGDFCSDKGMRPVYKKWFRYLKDNEGNEDVLRWDDFLSKYIGKSEKKKVDRESLEVGRKILEYLNSFGKPVFIVPGNWDQSFGETKIKNPDRGSYQYSKVALDWMLGETNKKLIRGLKNVYDCQFQLHKFPDFNILGYGLTNFPERRFIKRNFTVEEKEKLRRVYSKLEGKLKSAYMDRDKSNPTIFIPHNVPYNTKLDIIINKDSPIHKKHFGSTIARDFCRKYQPLVCIGGHIHEHFGKDKIGKTVVVNAGFGKYVNTFLEIKNGRIKTLKFKRGKK